ncbi:hypothetical protein GCM10028803_48570 [Larkinella knui]|uniref:Lipocalin-like domain-containing protein n=1 Tax=Larkinella knui TaxID=2025310 RepID=A0A3P1CQC5_9BACT|nr:hypothetical protein [Larkinella knui]RRB15431.1 hypothetical protein EHT87_12955 [Larkinella knui]
MKSLPLGIASSLLGLLASCTTGVRDIDLESKQFEATYNVDSTRGLDSARRQSLLNARAVYSFSKAGQGRLHTQIGMLSRDSSFTWKIKGDSLQIEGQTFAIKKQDNGYDLKSDSVMLILSQQP